VGSEAEEDRVMADGATGIRQCTVCGAVLGRAFRFCPTCSDAQPFAATPVESPPSRASEAVVPPASPAEPMRPAIEPIQVPRVSPVVIPSQPARPVRSGGLDGRLFLAGIAAVVVIAVGAALWPRAKAAKSFDLQVDADHWQSVDLRARLGEGRAFVVLTDAPLRLRTEGGRPITTAAGPVSLGDLADGRVEVKAVRGNARVSFAER